MDRGVRIVVVCLALVVFAIGLVALRNARGLVGQPWPGFGVLPNGEVGPSFFSAVAPPAGLDVPRFQERILAVNGEPLAGRGVLLRRLADVQPGGSATYTIGARDGSVRTQDLPVPRFTASDLANLYLPLFAGGTYGLLVGLVPVLARPRLLTTRLFFLFNLGLTLNFGYLALDYFTAHTLVPWGLIGAFLATGCLVHLAFLLPEPLPVLSRHPRVIPGLAYAGSAAGWLFWLVALYRSPAALRVADAIEILMFAVGLGTLLWNLIRSARHSTDASTRRLSRVIGLSGGLAAATSMPITLGMLLTGLRVPTIVHLLPLWALGVVVTWSMVAHNLFALDAVVRRGLTVALVTLVALAVQAGAFLVVRLFVDPVTAWAITSVAAVGLVAVTSVAAGVASGVEAAVERTLFPRLHLARGVVREAGRELVRRRDEGEIADVLRQALAGALTTSQVRVLAGSQGQPLVEIAPPAGTAPLRLVPSDPLYAISTAVDGLSLDGPAPRRSDPRLPAREQATALGVRLVAPLPAGHVVQGALLLGPRADGRLYTRDDEALVETLAAQAAVALEHAHAWATVQELERRLRAENLYLREEVAERTESQGEMVGRCPALRQVLAQADLAASTDAAILVLGETGTGKELLVRAIHAKSRRHDRVLVRVACAALPESLLESELFGYERGAFTGAVAAKPGRFEVADGGTLFLDDVDTLPLGVQAKLLRALQEGETQRLGSNRVRTVDVRIVAATNRDLLADVHAGRFREDLYYRLNVVPLRLPALRERREDIPALVEHFIRQDGPRLNSAVRAVSAEMLAALAAYRWPGNIRELRNVVQRALVLARDDVLRLPGPLLAEGDRGGADADPLAAGPLAEQLRDLKVRLIRAALERADGNQRLAAEALGLHRQSLTRMIRDLGLHDTGPGGKPARGPAATGRFRSGALGE